MSTGLGPTSRHASLLAILASAFITFSAGHVRGQTIVPSNSEGHVAAGELAKNAPDSSSNMKKPATTEEKLNALEQMLDQQNQRLDQLQQTIATQQETIRLLASKLNSGEASLPTTPATNMAINTKPAQAPTVEDRLKK